MHNIVILGANFAGTSTAHYLLRHVLPLLSSSSKTVYTITLISPSDHTFWKIAAPRAMQGPAEEQLQTPFYSIPDAFVLYPASSFKFILGKAVGIDENVQTLTVKTETEQTVHYDSLIIATGTTSNSPLWTLQNSFDDTISAFRDINTRLASPGLHEILIAGGGAAGVETAGEVGYRFQGKGKEITIFSGSKGLLPQYDHAGLSRAAASKLSALSVQVVHDLRVVSTTSLPDRKTELGFSDGTKKVVDLYIDATGGRPNSSFLPAAWLDSKGRVISEQTTLRTPVENVYAIGDVASYSHGNIADATWSIPALCYSIYEDLSSGGKGLKEKRYKQITSGICFIPIGAKAGVGLLFGWQLPSWIVWLLKSRDFMIRWAPGLANGERVMKA